MTEQLRLEWDWNPEFCIPPFKLFEHPSSTYLSVKCCGHPVGGSGWNALYTRGPLPEGDALEALKNSLLHMVELRYLQETVDDMGSLSPQQATT